MKGFVFKGCQLGEGMIETTLLRERERGRDKGIELISFHSFLQFQALPVYSNISGDFASFL